MFKRIRRRLLKRNNAGFTLVEVIVASALLGVLLLGVIGFTQPVLESVREKEQNARAVMLCETIESYIAQSTRYAYYVQTFSNVIPADVTSTSPTALAPIATKAYSHDASIAENSYKENLDGASLVNMLYCLNSVVGTTDYEIRCIGMRWLPDPRTGEKKLMLTNEVVDQKTCALDLTKSKQVFDPCYYDGLYPVLEYRDYSNQYQIIDPTTGALADKYAAADVTIAPGLDITMKVYLDSMCYAAADATRNSAQYTFSGTTFADYRNIGSVNTINTAKEYKINPCVEVRTIQDAYTADSANAYVNEEFSVCYYPDTYIYYIAKKVKLATTPATPTPPTPTP